MPDPGTVIGRRGPLLINEPFEISLGLDLVQVEDGIAAFQPHFPSHQEDPRRPRHWIHKDVGPLNGCRWCFIHDQIERTRPALNWIPTKPGGWWPIVIAVPVESVEAWLLTTQAILIPGTGSLYAEQEQRASYKMRLYGRPAATLEDVQSIALPIIRQLRDNHLQTLRDHSRSFSDFAEQIESHALEILTAPQCW